MFSRASGALKQFYFATSKQSQMVNESFMRAGLAEFRSLDDCAKREHRQAALAGEHHSMWDSRNPLIITMALLRDASVHATSCRTSTRETTVISMLGGEPHPYTYEAVILEPIPARELLERDRYKKTRKRHGVSLSLGEVERVLAWIADEQLKFGIAEVFRQGVQGYCREVLSRYA
jgi:hypothetical protein